MIAKFGMRAVKAGAMALGLSAALAAGSAFAAAKTAKDVHIIFITHGQANDVYWSVVKNGVQAGQAAMGVAGMFGNSGSGGDGGGGVHGTGTGSDQANIDSAFNAGDESTSSGGMAGDYSLPDETSATAAHGGEIEDTRAKDFVAALKRRRAA